MLLDIRKGLCPVCNGHEIIESFLMTIELANGVYPEKVTLQGAWSFTSPTIIMEGKKNYHSELKSYTCRQCGYTQLYADRPQKIRSASGNRIISHRDPEAEPYR